MSQNKPIKKLKAGAVSLAVFENNGSTKEGKSTAYNTISLQRSYKDKDGKWQQTGSLRLNDLPNAILLLQKTFECLALRPQNGNSGQEGYGNDALYEETL